MKEILKSIGTNALTNGSLSFAGLWAFPLVFILSVWFCFAVTKQPEPYVGMTLTQFEQLCPGGSQYKKDSDEWRTATELHRVRANTRDRRTNQCWGLMTFKNDKLTVLTQNPY